MQTKMANDNKYRCKKCGRPIKHKGNCLRCNLVAKREREKKIKAKRTGRIDLFAIKDNFSLGIEIDRSLIRLKSIEKLNRLRPNLAIFILKSRNINIKKNKSRLGLIRVRSLLIDLSEGKAQSLNPKGL